MAVSCAVSAIAQGVAQLPVHVFERGADGTRQRARDHHLSTILHDEVNDFTPSIVFKERLTLDALLHRVGGVAEIIRVDGKPVELFRLDPETITIETDAFGAPVYKVAGPNGGRTLSHLDVLHLTAPGGCPTYNAREAIGLALVMERYAGKLFANGARPGGLLSLDMAHNKEAFEKIRAAFHVAHSGDKSGGTAVIPAKAEYQQLTLSSVDAQFLEMRKFAIEEIARAYRVPPILLMEYGRATFDNSEEMGHQFVTYALLPWIKRWEGEIRLKLFAPDERESYFAEFLTDDLLRADLEKRAEAYSKLIAARVLNPNEVRALENRPPYAGGDEYSNPHTSSPSSPPANV